MSIPMPAFQSKADLKALIPIIDKTIVGHYNQMVQFYKSSEDYKWHDAQVTLLYALKILVTEKIKEFV
jgi:hypothetical protein